MQVGVGKRHRLPQSRRDAMHRVFTNANAVATVRRDARCCVFTIPTAIGVRRDARCCVFTIPTAIGARRDAIYRVFFTLFTDKTTSLRMTNEEM